MASRAAVPMAPMSRRPSRPAKRSRIGRTTFSWMVKSGRTPSRSRSLVSSTIPAASASARVAQRQRRVRRAARSPASRRVSGLPNIALASSVRPEPVRPVMPRISPLCSVKETSRGPLRTTARAPPATARPAVALSAASGTPPPAGGRSWPSPHLAGDVALRLGSASTTAPSRSTVISSQTSNTSFR